MTQVLPLSFTARCVTVQALLDLRTDTSPAVRTYVLELLKTELYTAVAESILEILVQRYPHKLTNQLLEAILPPHIRRLCLANCKNVSLSELDKLLCRCPKLQHLDLSNYAKPVTSQKLMAINTSCPLLTSLTLEACTEIRDSNIWPILRSCSCLTYLNISKCENITDNVFLLNEKQQTLIESGCQVYETFQCRLQNVDVSSCLELTSVAICHLCSLCGPSLKQVDIAGTNIGTRALLFLSGLSLPAVERITHFNDKIENMEPFWVDNGQALQIDRNGNDESTLKVHQETAHSPGHHAQGLAQAETPESLEYQQYQGTSDTLNILTEIKVAWEDTSAKPHSDTCSTSSTSEPVVYPGACTYEASSKLGDIVSPETDASVSSAVPSVKETSSIKDPSACAMETKQSSLLVVPLLKDTSSDNRDNQNCDNTNSIPNFPDTRGSVKRDFCDHLTISQTDCMSESEVCLVCQCGKTNLPVNTISLTKDNLELASGAPPNSDRLSLEAGLIEDLEAETERTAVPNNRANVFELFSDGSDNLYSKPDVDSSLEGNSNCLAIPHNSVAQDNRPDVECVGHISERDNTVRNHEQNNNTHSYSTSPIQNATPGVSDVSNQREQSVGQVRDKASRISRLYRPDLISLEVSRIDFASSLGTSAMKIFLMSNRNIEKLAMTRCALTEDLTKFIGQNARNLRSFSLLTDATGDMQYLTTGEISQVTKRCKNLQYVSLLGEAFVGDGALEPLLAGGQVRTLNLAECNITDNILKKLAETCSEKLTELDISWCEELKDEGINAVVTSCTALQKLYIRKCCISEYSLSLLAENCTNLTALNMSGVNSLTDTDMMRLSLKLRFLQKLDISWNSELSDKTSSALLLNCSHLQEVILSGVKRLSSGPFLPIIAKWKVVEDSDGNVSSDEEFKSLYLPHRSTSYAPNLQYLDLEYCDSMDDAELNEIVAVCRGTLNIKDYYGEDIQPDWHSCLMKGKLQLAL